MANKETSLPPRFLEKEEEVKKVLKYLFENVDNICFKGGTCLSMIHDVTKRFSEDIDITCFSTISNDQKKVNEKYSEILSILSKAFDVEDETVFINVKYKVEASEASSPELDRVINAGVIKVEPQTSKRKNIDMYEQVKMDDQIIYAQTLNGIFAEKISIFIERLPNLTTMINYLTNQERNNARHIYDLHKLSDKPFPKKEVKNILTKNLLKDDMTIRDKYSNGDMKFDFLITKFRDFNIAKSSWDTIINEFFTALDEHESMVSQNIKAVVYPIEENFKYNKLKKSLKKVFEETFKVLYQIKTSIQDPKSPVSAKEKHA